MHRVVLVTAVGAAACAEIPDRQAPEDLIGLGVDASTMQVNAADNLFTIQFAQSGVRLPTSFMHGGNEVLAADACPDPSLAGVSLAPMTTAVGGRQVTPALEPANTIQATMTGPAVAQIVVGYQVPYFCNVDQVLEGTSTFTVFPSGRIVRNDAVRPTQGGTIDVRNCGGCQAAQGAARLETFWNLASGGDRIELDSMGMEKILAPGAVGTERVACAIYPGYGLAIAWDGPGKPSTEAPSKDSALAFRYDFLQAAVTVSNTLETGSSTIALAPTGVSCASIAEKVQLPMLVIDDGGRKQLAPSAFGIYEYPTRIAGRVEIRTQMGEGYFHGVAFRLDLGDPDHIRVEHASGAKLDYLLQRDGNAYLIWVNDGISNDDPLVIEAT